MPKKFKAPQLLLLLLVVFLLPAWMCVADADGIFRYYFFDDTGVKTVCSGFGFTEPADNTTVPSGVVHVAWTPPRNVTADSTVQTVINGRETSPPTMSSRMVSRSVNAIDLDVSGQSSVEVSVSVPVSYASRGIFGVSYKSLDCSINITIKIAPPLLPQPPAMQCANFHFTSPRGGLLNAVNTFYWDPIPQATSYQINVYSGGTRIASWNADGAATSLQGDASGNAIGGANPFIVEAIAFDAYGQSCKDTVQMDREWLAPPPPPSLIEPPLESTPTCEENPDAPYCG